MRIRLVEGADAPAMAEVLGRNRDHLAPWDPERPEEFWTLAGQVARLESILAAHEAGRTASYAILDEEVLVGGITLDNIVRGPLQSANVGYWVDQECTGRGLASAALAAIIPLAFGEHGLHRLEAGTMLANTGSQRVLRKNGFEQFGMAPKFLHAAGAWQDHALFQLINDDWTS